MSTDENLEAENKALREAGELLRAQLQWMIESHCCGDKPKIKEAFRAWSEAVR